MGVHVDEPWRHDAAGRVDGSGSLASGLAQGDDLTVLDADVAGKSRRAGAVDDGAAADLEVVAHACSRTPVHYTSVSAEGEKTWPGTRSRSFRVTESARRFCRRACAFSKPPRDASTSSSISPSSTGRAIACSRPAR